MSLIEDITILLKEPLQAIGATIEEVNLRVERGEHMLHIAISRAGGLIDLDYIVKVTNIISPLMDQANLIDHHYMLDVSSAGIEKEVPIVDLSKHLGTYLAITLHKPWHGENKLLATLNSVHGDTITISGNLKGRNYNTQISIADIDKVREAIKF
ncbi:MAG TPA: hypothetical protein DCX17_04085 [Firmicutes bacterium]|jgi:ribosome maturation factor RimP|nr:hypothetical protein [Bacillota bacterium]